MEKAQHRGQSQKSGYYKMQKPSKPLETLKTLLSAKWKTAAQKMSQKTKRLLQMQKSSNPPETLQTILSAMGGSKVGRNEGGRETNKQTTHIFYLFRVRNKRQQHTYRLGSFFGPELDVKRAGCSGKHHLALGGRL
jgi:hypothetical protein